MEPGKTELVQKLSKLQKILRLCNQSHLSKQNELQQIPYGQRNCERTMVK